MGNSYFHMGYNNESGELKNKQKVTVEASTVNGIIAALGMEITDETSNEEPSSYPDELVDVLATIADIYEGVKIATEKDSRGRSRKMVRQYADREDLSSDAVGHILRVLEGHDLVVQDGNRWRTAAEEQD